MTTEQYNADRRGFLKCMSWAGSAMVWTIAGGIPRSHLIGRSDEAGPHRCGRALRDCFPAEGWGISRCVGIDGIDQSLPDLRRHIAAELGLDAARVHRGCAYAIDFVTPVELHGEQYVGGFRAAVRAELGVGRVLEVRIIEVYVGKTMTG